LSNVVRIYINLINSTNSEFTSKINILEDKKEVGSDDIKSLSKFNLLRNQITEYLINNVYMRQNILEDYIETKENDYYKSNSVYELIINQKSIIDINIFIDDLYKPKNEEFPYFNDIKQFDNIQISIKELDNTLTNWIECSFELDSDVGILKLDNSPISEIPEEKLTLIENSIGNLHT